MDVALDQGNALLCSGGTQLFVQGCAGQGDVAGKAALHPGVVALAHSTGSQHGVKQLGLLGIAASRTDADDIFHAVEVEQLVGVDADGGHPHTAAHHADGAAFVGAGKAQHPAHASHLPDILQKGVGNKFGTQGVTRHKDCLGEIAHFCADVRGRHR